MSEWPLDQARKQMGPFADAFALEQQVTTTRSRELGWKPRWRTIQDGIAEALG